MIRRPYIRRWLGLDGWTYCWVVFQFSSAVTDPTEDPGIWIEVVW